MAKNFIVAGIFRRLSSGGVWHRGLDGTVPVEGPGYPGPGRSLLRSAGIAVALCPMLLESAHYMKEDTALVFGISCSVFALAFLGKGISKEKTILLGAACATAASGNWCPAPATAFPAPPR